MGYLRMTCAPCQRQRQNVSMAATGAASAAARGNIPQAVSGAGQAIKATTLGAVMMAQKLAGYDLAKLYPDLAKDEDAFKR